MLLVLASRIAANVALLTIAPSILLAQIFGNPKVKITVTHPPLIALTGVTRIAIFPIRDATKTARCGADVGNQLTQALVTSGKFEVAARAQLDLIRAEVETQLVASKGFDDRTKTKLLKILGPAALVFGEITACEEVTTTEQVQRKSFLSRTPETYMVARTRVSVAGSLQLVELETGRIYSAKAFDGRHEGGSEADARDPTPIRVEAARKAVAEFMKTIVPWTEVVEVLLYDDDKWNLKKGAAFVKAGEFERASMIFRDSISAQSGAKVDQKLMAKAHHNLGISLMYSGHAKDALDTLVKALDLNPNGSTEEAIRRCRELIANRAEIESQQDHGVAIGGGSTAQSPKHGVCPHCAATVTEGAKFCPNCGRSVEKRILEYCPNSKCASKVGPNDKFCAKCGQSLRPQ